MSVTKWIDHNSPYLADLNLSASEQGRASKACEAATTALERAIHRKISKAQHDEIYHANDDGSLVLRNFPVVSIDQIWPSTAEVVTIINNDATVSSSSFATLLVNDVLTLRLRHNIGGTTTTTDLASTTYPTLATLVTAVNAVGHGWSAALVGRYSIFPTADLLTNQYTNCKDTRGLRLWTQTNSTWVLTSEDQGLVEGEFMRGQQVRMLYTAGFADIPEDLKQICAAVVKDLMGDTSASIQSESLGGYSYTLAQGAISRLPRTAREILASYKDRIV